MAGSSASQNFRMPTVLPLGDCGLLVRFGGSLTDAGNRAAIALSQALDRSPIEGVVEVVPNLVSVLMRYDPLVASASTITGELRLRLFGLRDDVVAPERWTISARFDGPDLDEVASMLGLTAGAFIDAHSAFPLRVLATGFAPGFVYCGLHPDDLVVPRRSTVRPSVPAGSILFAAGQTAIAATEMPTGWHLIGHTDFRNFDAGRTPPTQLAAGDSLAFKVTP